MIQKVCVLGNTASGKSFLASRIAQLLKMESISLDQIFWKQNWTSLSLEAFYREQQKILKQEAWVIDGTFSECGLAERFEAADLVVFLDSNPLVCLLRAIKRRGKDKKRLPKGADDTQLSFGQSLKFALEILRFNGQERSQILLLASQSAQKFIFLHHWKEEAKLLERIRKNEF